MLYLQFIQLQCISLLLSVVNKDEQCACDSNKVQYAVQRVLETNTSPNRKKPQISPYSKKNKAALQQQKNNTYCYRRSSRPLIVALSQVTFARTVTMLYFQFTQAQLKCISLLPSVVNKDEQYACDSNKLQYTLCSVQRVLETNTSTKRKKRRYHLIQRKIKPHRSSSQKRH